MTAIMAPTDSRHTQRKKSPVIYNQGIPLQHQICKIVLISSAAHPYLTSRASRRSSPSLSILVSQYPEIASLLEDLVVSDTPILPTPLHRVPW
ncbi:hypothetical protein AQUCO_01500361v1 [Aquilegia coerulea]|uniref:Uncharacterized protein n=1 Tax=Aquilegia coerulea TaxID=218851 RepID=A0A2G5DTC3_AQUCA|nr:hypothetical protein AQUCO_01500361v1 [Aquilegia coerulea]PIA46761.1 hypothetical protein AQUCO_01500361v1 [Aquilegia coerulea]